MNIGAHPSRHYETDRLNCMDGEDEGMMARGGGSLQHCRQAKPNKVMVVESHYYYFDESLESTQVLHKVSLSTTPYTLHIVIYLSNKWTY